MRPLRRELFGSAAFGLAVIAVFVVGGAAWSMRAPLSSAVIANGAVEFENRRKTVQHLEGGIIKELFVREGDRVEAGTVLLTLDDTSSRARAEELLNRIRNLAGEEARLEAERARKPQVAFTHPMLQDTGNADVASVIEQQRSLFDARAENLVTRERILRKRIDQLGRQAQGVKKQLAGVRTRLKLIREEEESVAGLLRDGYARKPRLLAIQRAEAELVGTEGELLSTLARNQETVGEIEFQIASLETGLLEEVDARLSQVQAERVSAEKLYWEMRDRLQRTRVLSPAGGVVLNMRFKTIGGVIQPGEPILDIAPTGDELIVNARVQPIDVDEVIAGSAATIVFPAYHSRYLKRIEGEVIRVSADTVEDKTTGTHHYVAVVRVDPKHMAEVAPDITLSAGMPAEVYIATGTRTLYDFLVEPIQRTFARSLRES